METCIGPYGSPKTLHKRYGYLVAYQQEIEEQLQIQYQEGNISCFPHPLVHIHFRLLGLVRWWEMA